MSDAVAPTILIVPGFRDHVEDHWQTLLAGELPNAVTVPPMGRESLDRAARIGAVEAVYRGLDGPVIVVAHSGGVITFVQWVFRLGRQPAGALLATPPDFDSPMPAGYPTRDALAAAGWLPIPRERLEFPTIVAASRNDPLADFDVVASLARAWGSRLVDLGDVGHLNPASGYGPWPQAESLVAELENQIARSAERAPRGHQRG